MARESKELATRADARARYVRVSPSKIRQVAALIRGKPLDEARRILAFTPKAAGRELAKVLEAAAA
ncbi:MAG: large ribosomal subunit protein uL22, partial [Candidatus Methylomirabilales bacterium]